MSKLSTFGWVCVEPRIMVGLNFVLKPRHSVVSCSTMGVYAPVCNDPAARTC